MGQDFAFSRHEFNELFPFYFSLDKGLNIIESGSSLHKLIGQPLPYTFGDCFHFLRPKTEAPDFAQLQALGKNLLILGFRHTNGPMLRGQFVTDGSTERLLFVGSPWVGDIQDLRQYGLAMRDFAVHDPLIDLLHLIQTHDIAMRDLRQLLETLRHQRNELDLARAELKSRNLQLSTLFSSMQSAVLLEDEQRRISLVNQRFCEFFSIPVAPEVLIGTDCSDSAEVSKHLFKDPESFVSGINRLLEWKKIETGTVLEMEDGKVLERDYIPIFIGETYKGHLWVYRDITEKHHFEAQLQAKEEHFRSILSNMNHGLLEVNMDGIVQFTNQRFAEMSGLPMDKIIGFPTSEVFKRNEDAYEKIKSLRGTFEARNLLVSVHVAGGARRWWYVGYAPRFSDNDTVIGSIGVYQDITQIKELEYELVEARLQAEETARARENYLANMSHEIRTLMNAVIGMTGQLAKSILSEKQRFQLGVIQTAADNLMEMINDNLDLSKISAGKMQLENVPFSPYKVLADVLRMQAHRAAEKGIYLDASDEDAGVSEVLIGDAVRVKQILMNLVNNAVKFTSQGGVLVHLQLARNIEQRQEIRFVVEDSGIGMEPEFVEHLFDEYSQERVPREFQSQGTGLGMHIVWNLVKLMHGEIRVDSSKGKGTRISVTLPFSVGKTADLHRVLTLNSPPLNLKGLQVLVVDDNEVNRLLARNILENHQARVLEATDGSQAVNMCARIPDIDAILMDLQMPEMDGYAAAVMIRSDLQSAVPIIALSADAIQGERERCINSGMNDYLSKPYTEAQLLRVLGRFMPQADSLPSAASDSEKQQAYSLIKLQELGKGSHEFTARMISRFLQMVPADLDSMEAAFRKGDTQTMGHIAHKLKPSLDIFNIETLIPVVTRLELLRREPMDRQELETHFHLLQQGLRLVLDHLRLETSHL